MQQDGLPGTRLVRGAMLTFGIALVLAVYLLIAPPTLPNERERTGGAPPAGSPAPGVAERPGGPATAPGAVPSSSQPAGEPATASPAPSASPQPARTHTIQSGDTLLDIAEQYDTTVDAIRAANPGLNETALTVGQPITIPPSR